MVFYNVKINHLKLEWFTNVLCNWLTVTNSDAFLQSMLMFKGLVGSYSVPGEMVYCISGLVMLLD